MQDIGRSKRAARSFSLDDVAIMPTRRTRGIETVDIDWRIDAITFDFPLMAAPMDSVMSPATAIAFEASMGDPPPKATIASQSLALKNSMPFSISGMGASGVISSNTT